MPGMRKAKLLAFSVFMVAASMFVGVQARQVVICPYYECVTCDTDPGWTGPCYTTSGDCSDFECDGGYGTCTLDGTTESRNLCVCGACPS